MGTYRYIGVGRKCSTNAHNQRLMEIKPFSMAMMAAWVRSEASSLLSIRPTWFLTVLVLRSNSLAICSLVRPLAMGLNTSASRGESFPVRGGRGRPPFLSGKGPGGRTHPCFLPLVLLLARPAARHLHLSRRGRARHPAWPRTLRRGDLERDRPRYPLHGGKDM